MSTCPSGRCGSVSVPFMKVTLARFWSAACCLARGQKIVEDIFRDHVARRAHAPAQERQHVAHAGADVRHRHARLRGPSRDQFAAASAV